MSFLPENYESPSTSNNYMKLQDGENRIRILSRPIVGWEDWKDKKPVRFKMNEKPAAPIDESKPIKHFWAFVVWNYAEQKVQILQINQAGIRKAIENLSKDADWGAPYFYDLKIFKKGEGKDTEYSVNPSPHKEVASNIQEAFKRRPICLEAMFCNADPFAAVYENYEAFMCVSEPSQIAEVKRSKISIAQCGALTKKLELVPNYKAQIDEYLGKKGIHDYMDIPLEMLSQLVNGADKAYENENLKSA